MMNKITKQAEIIIKATTCLWALLMIVTSCMMYFEVEIHTHQSVNILLEFSKSVTLWYVLSILTAFLIDRTTKNKQ